MIDFNWSISNLESDTETGGVITVHWRCTAADGDHSGSSYGTCGFTPDSSADGYTAYADITEAQAIGWVKDSMGEEAVTGVEDSIAAQIADSKAPAITAGVPW